MLRQDKDRLIKYNYPKVITIKKKRIYKTLESV